MTDNQSTPYINIHTHYPARTSTERAVINILAAELNEIQLDDDKLYSAGLHPWHIVTENFADNINKVALAAKQKNIIAIGEIGLDKTIQVPFNLQIECFLEQVAIANKYKKPVIIHCVRAFNELLQLKQQIDTCTPWIIHGFKGKEIMMLKLIDHGCYISFGNDLFKHDSHSQENLRFVSDKQIFFETDIADEKIEPIYRQAAHIRQQDVNLLKSQIANNFTSIFNIAP